MIALSRPGRRRALVALSLASVLALLTFAPASATIVHHERYADSDTFDYDFCGFVVDVTVEFGGLLQFRAGTNSLESAFFVQDNYWYRETHVPRPAGLQTVVLSGNGLFKETKATHVEGTIFEFTAIDAGQVFTARDGDGNVLFRDRGNRVATIRFDTLGDDTPGGEFVSFVGESFHGQFPSLDGNPCMFWE